MPEVDWLLGAIGTVGVAVAGWIGSLQGRLTKVETQQMALKERLDSFEQQILRRLDRIDEKLDDIASGRSHRQ